jgi:hypothetical protein
VFKRAENAHEEVAAPRFSCSSTLDSLALAAACATMRACIERVIKVDYDSGRRLSSLSLSLSQSLSVSLPLSADSVFCLPSTRIIPCAYLRRSRFRRPSGCGTRGRAAGDVKLATRPRFSTKTHTSSGHRLPRRAVQSAAFPIGFPSRVRRSAKPRRLLRPTFIGRSSIDIRKTQHSAYSLGKESSKRR